MTKNKIKKWEPDDFKLEMSTHWSFPKCSDWATHNAKYKGSWSPYIPRNLLLRYSQEGDLVLDQFVGGGSALVEAKLLNRNIIGIDVNELALKICKEKIDFEWEKAGKICLSKGDARNLHCILDDEIDFICTHPPYCNSIKYSDDDKDLSHYKIPQFLKEMKKVALESFRVLKNDKFCVIFIGDVRKRGYIQPLGFEIMNIFIEAGFSLKEIIIKAEQDFKANGYFKNNSLKYNFLPVAHGYLFVFKKIKNKHNQNLQDIKSTLASSNPPKSFVDILENKIREEMPEILELLLTDRTTAQNIIWANDDYKKYGQEYDALKQIKPELITKNMGHIIMSRSLKTRQLQKERTKSKAEVFTPLLVVKMQNDEIDKNYKKDDLEIYIKRKWLEITCGEAPYMTTRYDMQTGDFIPVQNRVGFVDRKLERINKEVQNKALWQKFVEFAYKSSYGFEWNGDSLLLARENLLYTYRDYYVEKWCEKPSINDFKEIARIISYNIFQMDGLKNIIPMSEKKIEVKEEGILRGLEDYKETKWAIKGIKVKIMNWETDKMEEFDKGVT